jgi:hypothetical protein
MINKKSFKSVLQNLKRDCKVLDEDKIAMYLHGGYTVEEILEIDFLHYEELQDEACEARVENYLTSEDWGW